MKSCSMKIVCVLRSLVKLNHRVWYILIIKTNFFYFRKLKNVEHICCSCLLVNIARC